MLEMKRQIQSLSTNSGSVRPLLVSRLSYQPKCDKIGINLPSPEPLGSFEFRRLQWASSLGRVSAANGLL